MEDVIDVSMNEYLYLRLVSTKMKQTLLRTLFHGCDEYEKGIKGNSGSFCDCLKSETTTLMTL